MRIKIKRFDKELPLPAYQTSGAVAMDLSARLETTVPPKELVLIPLNIALEIPEGYFALMAPRSSLPKRGLMAANSIGIFDQDFKGDNDEYRFAAYNYTDQEVIVEKGERIAQLLFIQINKVELDEVESLGHTDRGGFGSTGK